MRNNDINDNDASHLANAVKDSKGLRKIDLRHNKITSKGA